MINAVFYTFLKRKNSTAIVSGAGLTVPVLLKDDCSVESPTLELNSDKPTAYNYCYIEDFGRYYFIDDYVCITGTRWKIQLSEDYLATYKAQILAMTGCFVEYCSSPTNLVPDTRLGGLTVPNTAVAYSSLNNTTFTSNGFGVISSTGNKTSGLFILQNVDDIIDIFDGIDWDQIPAADDIAAAFKKASEQFFTKDSASRNLRSAFSLPWVVHGAAIGQAVNNLKIGAFPTGKTVYRVAQEIVTDHCTITIPWGYSDWHRSDKYTDLILYLPLFGLVNLPVDELLNDSQIRVTYAFSYSNGDVSYQVQGLTSNHIVAIGTTNASAPLAVGVSNVNNTKLATSVVAGLGSVAAIATGGAALAAEGLTAGGLAAVGMGASGLVSSGISAVDAIGGKAFGGGGGFGGFACAALDTAIHLYRFTRVFTENPATMGVNRGYPNFRILSLASLTGYCKCANTPFNGGGTAREKDVITGYLNSGFYIE